MPACRLSRRLPVGRRRPDPHLERHPALSDVYKRQVQSIEISPAVTVADDDLCTITITEKFKDDWGDIGFVVNITNKSDKDPVSYTHLSPWASRTRRS